MRDLSLGETGGPGFVLANGRQLARTSDGRWLAITDIKQRVTGRASVVIRAGAVAPVEDADFQESLELAGNLGNSLLGDRLGSADQGSIAVDSRRRPARGVAPHGARNGKGELWYARCPLRGGDLGRPGELARPRRRRRGSRAAWTGRGTARQSLGRHRGDGRRFGLHRLQPGGDWTRAASMLARPAAGGWRRTPMTERWDYGDPVLDVDESGTIHLAYGPDPRELRGQDLLGRLRRVRGGVPAEIRPRIAERYGIYYSPEPGRGDLDPRRRAHPRRRAGRLFASDHPTIAASRGTILIGYMARGNWPGMVDRVFYSSYRRPGSGEHGAGRWKMHVNLNRDESQEVGLPIAFVDGYGQPRLAWVNRDRHHVFMSRWMGGGMATPQGIRWAWELAPALSVEKRMPAGSDVFGLLYLTADGEIRFGRVEVPAIDPRRAGNVLFLDLWELAERRHVDLVVNTAKKDPRNPVLQGEPGSWDSQAICYGTVLYDEGRYRMWYTARSGTTDCAVCCYAVSDDGITWERPNLGLFEYHGSTRQQHLRARRDPAAGAADPQRPADPQSVGRTRTNASRIPPGATR